MFDDIIEGTVYWPYFRSLHPLGKKYQVTVGQLDREVAEKLKVAGAKVTRADDKGLCVTFKSTKPIEVVDASMVAMSDSQVGRIGNGSKGKFNVRVIPTKFSNSAQALNGVQIIQLVEFTGKAQKSFQVEEGFKAGQTNDFEAQVND